MLTPFYCGTQYMDWRYNNCDRCKKDYDWEKYPNNGKNNKCKAEEALSLASISSGKISNKIAKFIAFKEGHYIWLCPHLEPTKEAR